MTNWLYGSRVCVCMCVFGRVFWEPLVSSNIYIPMKIDSFLCKYSCSIIAAAFFFFFFGCGNKEFFIIYIYIYICVHVCIAQYPYMIFFSLNNTTYMTIYKIKTIPYSRLFFIIFSFIFISVCVYVFVCMEHKRNFHSNGSRSKFFFFFFLVVNK